MHAAEAVVRVVKAFQLAQVPVVLAAGTMLGWVRFCDIIEHTNDLDFYVPTGHIVSDEHYQLLVVC
jgi:Mg/Co/Ni transporter MgtE